jgi:hypothetical protein
VGLAIGYGAQGERIDQANALNHEVGQARDLTTPDGALANLDAAQSTYRQQGDMVHANALQFVTGALRMQNTVAETKADTLHGQIPSVNEVALASALSSAGLFCALAVAVTRQWLRRKYPPEPPQAKIIEVPLPR